MPKKGEPSNPKETGIASKFSPINTLDLKLLLGGRHCNVMVLSLLYGFNAMPKLASNVQTTIYKSV